MALVLSEAVLVIVIDVSMVRRAGFGDTMREQVLACFENIEKPSLAGLPLTRFDFYHEAKRKVSRDGYISVNRSFYSVPPEYLGRDVWVRHDSHLVRIFDENLRHIATHTITEQGRFKTDAAHIASQKISLADRGIDHLQHKMRLIGPSATTWADAVVAGCGVDSTDERATKTAAAKTVSCEGSGRTKEALLFRFPSGLIRLAIQGNEFNY